jgi:hypothetical protein
VYSCPISIAGAHADFIINATRWGFFYCNSLENGETNEGEELSLTVIFFEDREVGMVVITTIGEVNSVALCPYGKYIAPFLAALHLGWRYWRSNEDMARCCEEGR